MPYKSTGLTHPFTYHNTYAQFQSTNPEALAITLTEMNNLNREVAVSITNTNYFNASYLGNLRSITFISTGEASVTPAIIISTGVGTIMKIQRLIRKRTQHTSSKIKIVLVQVVLHLSASLTGCSFKIMSKRIKLKISRMMMGNGNFKLSNVRIYSINAHRNTMYQRNVNQACNRQSLIYRCLYERLSSISYITLWLGSISVA